MTKYTSLLARVPSALILSAVAAPITWDDENACPLARLADIVAPASWEEIKRGDDFVSGMGSLMFVKFGGSAKDWTDLYRHVHSDWSKPTTLNAILGANLQHRLAHEAWLARIQEASAEIC